MCGDEWIVFGDEQECWDADIRDDAQSACAVVIIIGIAVAAVGSGDEIVKFAESMNFIEAFEIVSAGKHYVLSAHSSF